MFLFSLYKLPEMTRIIHNYLKVKCTEISEALEQNGDLHFALMLAQIFKIGCIEWDCDPLKALWKFKSTNYQKSKNKISQEGENSFFSEKYCKQLI